MNNNIYIDLLKKTLIDYHRIGRKEYGPLPSTNQSKVLRVLGKFLQSRNLSISVMSTSKAEDRINGKDWPAYADTMIGLKRLENIEYCVNKIIEDKIEGDMIETGVWRGGATIFMKALLKVNNINDKIVWVADSFEGLPKPNVEKYSQDKGDIMYSFKELAIPMEIVRDNFKKYDLLDENVKFLKGWFKDTLPGAPINKLSLIRLDGDMYESTMDGLNNLYHKLSPGGFIIIDDYGAIEACKQAIHDFRDKHGVKDKIEVIDWTGVYWRKLS